MYVFIDFVQMSSPKGVMCVRLFKKKIILLIAIPV